MQLYRSSSDSLKSYQALVIEKCQNVLKKEKCFYFTIETSIDFKKGQILENSKKCPG